MTDKKEASETKEDSKSNEASEVKDTKEVKSDSKVVKKPAAKGGKEKSKTQVKTPEQLAAEKRDREAKKIIVTLYGDGQLNVTSMQNVATRSEAEYLVYKAVEEYKKHDIASATSVMILDMIAKSQKRANEINNEKRIVVPGQK